MSRYEREHVGDRSNNGIHIQVNVITGGVNGDAFLAVNGLCYLPIASANCFARWRVSALEFFVPM
jgi:hypothetical protein